MPNPKLRFDVLEAEKSYGLESPWVRLKNRVTHEELKMAVDYEMFNALEEIKKLGDIAVFELVT